MPPQKRYGKTITVHLTDEQYRLLCAVAERDGRSLAQTGRLAVREYVSKEVGHARAS